MNAIAAMSPESSAQDPEPLGRPYEYKMIRVPPRPAPKTAFGLLLDSECCRRWTRWYCELVYKDKFFIMTPQEIEEELDDFESTCTRMLPGLIYHEFPNLPRLRNRLLPVVDRNYDDPPKYHVFVLRDDATWQGMNVPLDRELIEAVARRLGVPGQEPGWYKIAFGAH
ncbi:hypothetical protein L226DRAFT_574355 [Lentinus tigrinus ALCF2SS1-7]|uniref:Uncharacterized protein n=1 Tax=Lentinus tigrinus ALCF2SS1-6 TaxID=1328759 RepID=A0A5C2S9I6_9APHY|nr:hypothetical protein L227DRAFT_611317 [Lentinus tigrinus ALCF2SS1-6]RPD70903.1 hypothetical protein L226DRAFT_574355 [Lentinus tigrinus ALCF2SS1-7]